MILFASQDLRVMFGQNLAFTTDIT